jgi:hypothetical protein
MSFDQNISFRGDKIIEAIGLADVDQNQEGGEGIKKYKSVAGEGENTTDFSF